MTLKMTQSNEFYQQANQYLVGGVNSPVRSFSKVNHDPIFVKSAHGAIIKDVDDNEYVDFVLSYGPHLFGHQPDFLVEAIKKVLPHGICFGMTSETEILWAKKLLSFFPYYSKARAVNSGTEATMTAIRLARGCTQRNLIIKFTGNYHGHVDSLLMDAGSGLATKAQKSIPECLGIPENLASHTIVLPYNDSSALKECFNQNKDTIAAVILEPMIGNMGFIPATQDFIDLLRSTCSEHKTILIFDEVMTGFRCHSHSAADFFNVEPDISCFGKVVGGGIPLGAIVGKEEYMIQLAPLGDVYQAGTLSGNPLAMTAGLAMLNKIEIDKPLEDISLFTRKLCSFIRDCIQKNNLKMIVQNKGSMMSLFFRESPVTNAEQAREIDYEQFKKFFNLCVSNGIMIPPSPFETWFTSTAHLDLDFTKLCNRFEKVFSEL